MLHVLLLYMFSYPGAVQGSGIEAVPASHGSIFHAYPGPFKICCPCALLKSDVYCL